MSVGVTCYDGSQKIATVHVYPMTISEDWVVCQRMCVCPDPFETSYNNSTQAECEDICA